MQLDMHYYATYAMARAAGIECFLVHRRLDIILATFADLSPSLFGYRHNRGVVIWASQIALPNVRIDLRQGLRPVQMVAGRLGKSYRRSRIGVGWLAGSIAGSRWF